jgi:CelD/BcsL family acetyltransferase involved in cellulose biosynthesis
VSVSSPMTPIEEMACDLSDASETLIDSADTAAAVVPENFLDANEEKTAALINADPAAQADATGALQPAESLDVAKAEQAPPDDLDVLETGATAGREDQPPLP